MDFYQKLYENVYFPFFEGFIKKRKTAKIFREACISEWLPQSELQAGQLKALNALASFALNECDYYAENITAQFPLDSLDRLSEFPILTKDTIKNNFDALIAKSHKTSLWKKSTGGSTGQPLHFGYTKESYEWRVAMSKRGYSWAGAAPGTKQAYIWGVQLGVASKKQQIKEKLHHFIDRQKYFNCFDFGQAEMSLCLNTLNSWRPDVLVGYTNPLYEFALYVESVGGPKFEPQSVLCAAEKVHPFQREVLERVFGCPVFNTYGSREFMLIASECEKHEGLHVSMENLIVEVVDDKGASVGPGEVGRILVTDLHNYGMPFIRYEIGDMARVSERQCSCGRGLLLLDDIVGRSLDVIRTPEGKAVPGEFFPHLLKDYPAISRFQVVQKELSAITIKYQVVDNLDSDTRQKIINEVENVVGSDTRIIFEQVNDIPLTKSGKYRVTISELGQDD